MTFDTTSNSGELFNRHWKPELSEELVAEHGKMPYNKPPEVKEMFSINLFTLSINLLTQLKVELVRAHELEAACKVRAVERSKIKAVEYMQTLAVCAGKKKR